MKDNGGSIIIVGLYVDDLSYTGNNDQMFEEFKESMKNKFDMIHLQDEVFPWSGGKAEKCRNLHTSTEICQRDPYNIWHGSIQQVCNPIIPVCRLTKDECGKSVGATTYKQMVGYLMYVLTVRLDLAYSVYLMARYMERLIE